MIGRVRRITRSHITRPIINHTFDPTLGGEKNFHKSLPLGTYFNLRWLSISEAKIL